MISILTLHCATLTCKTSNKLHPLTTFFLASLAYLVLFSNCFASISPPHCAVFSSLIFMLPIDHCLLVFLLLYSKYCSFLVVLHTSGPSSCMSGRHLPLQFQQRVLPECQRIPAKRFFSFASVVEVLVRVSPNTMMSVLRTISALRMCHRHGGRRRLRARNRAALRRTGGRHGTEPTHEG